MNPAKYLNMAKRSFRNLTLKDQPMDDPRSVLEACFPDAGSSCYVERPAEWDRAELDLSIILPTWNDAAHICRSLDSVLNQQTEYRFEVVVINDGSPDHTAQLLKKYENLPNVQIIHQENRGHSGARNAGLAQCRGAYILFHDSDDTLLPGAVQNLLACAFAHGADVVAGGYLEERPAGDRYPGLRYPEGEADAASISGMTCGKVYRRCFFEHLQFPVGYWYEDSIIAQIILPQAKNVWCIAPEVFAYLQNESGVSAASVGRPKSLDSLYITGSLLADKPKFGLPYDREAYEHFLYMMLLTYHRTCALDGKIQCALFRQQQALKSTYFPDMSVGTKLEKALVSGNFSAYLRCCEFGWLKLRFRR